MDLQTIHSEAFGILPLVIQLILSYFPGTYILGGFGICALRNIPFNDIDLFIPHKFAHAILSLLSKFKFEEFCPYEFLDSIHLSSFKINEIKVDLISFGPKFNPKTHVDFHCRMVQFTGESFVFPTVRCLSDIMTGILCYNNDYKSLSRLVHYVHEILTKETCRSIWMSTYECAIVSTLKRNTSKYKDRDWIVYVAPIPAKT